MGYNTVLKKRKKKEKEKKWQHCSETANNSTDQRIPLIKLQHMYGIVLNCFD